MSHSGTESRVRARVYMVLLLAGLVFVMAMPVYMYFKKSALQPKEFSRQEKHYVTLEVRVSDIMPELLSMVKVGDIQKDYNGEENARIMAIVKIEPQIAGKVSVDGSKQVDIVSSKKDLYLTVRARYDKNGDYLVIHPTATKLMIGGVILFEFPDYYLQSDIIKIIKE